MKRPAWLRKPLLFIPLLVIVLGVTALVALKTYLASGRATGQVAGHLQKLLGGRVEVHEARIGMVGDSIVQGIQVFEEGQTDKPKRRQPVLLLTVGKTDKETGPIFVSYLARGMAWAPSYRVDISDPKTLTLEQSAVIKNELADLDDAAVFLISGFPSTQFAHVTSPLSTRTSWAAFFQEHHTTSFGLRKKHKEVVKHLCQQPVGFQRTTQIR